ncbi:PAS domain S-box protein [Anabaena sphaerica FACHB-251]|uniref:Circadian input-output histidine kinase CikA n=1 Tax=Anabaena sphaerica FACHB-251 TaxID=2692883 RepID=A0A926WK75_9NOST|nr:PAS domain S-box protein [Anabaena sphaerica]MBD2296086.1 PAS domain S-box protein [Anabaena sphaerica FACHB-251]
MLFSSLIEANNLEQAVADTPLVVTADTLASEAIALMSNARGSCTLPEEASDTSYLLTDCRASCVLVMQETKLLGIFTERDVVRLSAEGRQIAGVAIADVMTHSVITLRQSEFTDIFVALNLFQRHRIRHLPILNDHGQIAGLLTHESLRQLLRPVDLLRLRLVSEVMSSRIVKATPETYVLDITKLMARDNVSSVIIVEEENSLLMPVGIMTERDIVQFQALGLDLQSIQAGAVMSSPVFSLSRDDNLLTVLTLMQSRRINRVVITGEQGELLGIVTQTTLLQALNPLDIYSLVDNLKQKVSRLEVEKLELLQIRNAELEQEVQKRTAELQSQAERERLLSGITSRIRRSLDLQETLNAIALEIRQFLNCDRVLVYQYHGNGTGIIIAEDVKPGWLSLLGQSVSDPCFTPDWIEQYINGRIQVVEDIATDDMSPCHRQLLVSLQIRAKILVPIVVGNQLWGLMLACQNDAARIWQPEETELLEQLSIHLAIAIQQADLYHRLQLELQERQRAEAALAESEELYRTTLNNISDALFITDDQGKFTFICPNVDILFGYSVEDVAQIGNIQVLISQNLFDPQQLAFSGEITNIECDIFDQQGKKHTVLVNVKQVKIGAGTLLYSCRNITERKQVERALQDSEERLRTIVETSASGLVTVDHQGKIVFVNPAAARMFGRDIEILCGWPFALPYDYDSHRVEEIEVLQASGQRRTVNMQAAAIAWEGQDAFLMSLSDITDLKQTEELLRQSEAKYRLLVENLPLGLIVHGVDTSILTSNAKACELLELTISQMQGKTALDPAWYFFREDETLMPPSEYPINQVISTLQPLTNYVAGVNRPQSKTQIWLLVNAFPEFNSDKTLKQVVVTFVDINERQAALKERKLAEIALRNSEERFRQIAENLPEVIWMTNIEKSEIIFVSRQYEKIWGRSLENLYQQPKTWIAAIHEDDRKRVIKAIPNQTTLGEYDEEYRIIKPDGIVRWIRDRAFPIENEDGKVYRIAGFAEDITQRKEAEEQLRQLNEELEARVEQRTTALRESQAMLQLVLDTIPQRVFWKDHQSVIRGCNRILAEDIGLTPEEIIGRDPYDISATREEVDFYLECDRLVLTTGKPQLHIQETLHKPDGSLMWIETNKVPLRDADGNIIGILVTYEDITSRRTAEEALRYSEERFRIALNNSPIVVFNQDLDLRYTWIYNPALGYKPEEVVARFDTDLFLPKDAEKLQTWKRQVLETGQGMREEIVIGTEDNFICYVLTIDPLRDRHGEIEGVTCAALDITDRKKAEMALKESQYLIQCITEASPDILYIYDLQEKRNIYINREIARLLGYSPAEIQSMGTELFLQLAHPDDIPKMAIHHARFATANDQDIWEIEYRMRDRQGHWHWFLSHDTLFSRDAENQPKQIIGAALEMTERKQMEAELRQTNAELARATRLKDEFLANMSHELRTPLNAILGMSEGLLEGVFDEISDHQTRAIKTIERSGKHLLELINDILDLSKVEAGKLELQLAPVACTYLCDSSLTFVKQQALKKNIHIAVDIPPNIPDLVVDERRIRQMLINLLNNAVKFTPNGGSVKLLVQQEMGSRGAEENNFISSSQSPVPSPQSPSQWICFSVIDTGIGIAKEELDKLFQPFVQIDSSLNRQHNGTGLGLALVQRLVELHGGQITVTSEVGKGSCFTVRIPCMAVGNRDKELGTGKKTFTKYPMRNPNTENSHVLIIEDSIVAAEQVARYLNELNLQTTIYTKGEGAVDEAIRLCPVLILLDIQLPNLSGWEVLGQLKAHPETQNIPVIVISVVDERSQALSLGASDYFVKPISRDQIRQTLNKLQHPDHSSTNALIIAPTTTPIASPIEPNAPHLILLAEDNEANTATISNYLGARGYNIIMAKNGQAAVTLTKEQHPKLILMDIQMPGMDGLQAIRLIRADHQFIDTPIIALTALAMPGDKEKCIAAGANDYLTKPIKLKFLVEKIQQLLNQGIGNS